ncbi:MAG: PKD domain-containing protein, partial [Erysipelotrichales bacterium]
EPNDSRELANGPIASRTNVSGSFNNGDSNDYYYFDVTEEGECNISVESSSTNEFTWTVSPEGSDEYVAYPSNGNTGSFMAKPGRYHMSVYTWNSGNIDYTINIDKAGGEVTPQPDPENNLPVAMIVAPTTAIVGESVSFNGTQSSDSDGTIVSYKWNFGDGSTSTQINPNHAFNAQGTYGVSLTVTDDNGASTTMTKNITVSKKAVVNGITRESEPNDSRDSANGPIVSGTSVSGTFANGDSNDWYYFDVTEEGECNISVESSSTNQFTWTVSPEGSDEYVAYPSDGNSGSFMARPGRYHMSVYTWGSSDINYTINIDKAGGEITPPTPTPTPGITEEMEPNNTFDKANGNIGSGVEVSAAFTGSDKEDIFSFEVLEQGELDILVNNNSNSGLSWMLFKEGQTKLHQSVAYDTGDNVNLTGNYTARPGKYYLYVYKYSGSNAEYTVNINGALK